MLCFQGPPRSDCKAMRSDSNCKYMQKDLKCFIILRPWTDGLKSFNAPIEKLKLFRTNIPVMVSKTQNNLAPMEIVAQ